MTDQDAAPDQDVVPAGAAAAQLPDWRDLLEMRRFNAAKQAYLVAKYAAAGRALPDAAVDDDAQRAALTALADVEDLLRERRYAKAAERLERLESRPAIAPWHELEAELGVLTSAAKALDMRDPDAALEALAERDLSWFVAEGLTLEGTALIYAGDEAAARPIFESAVEIDPKHYRALTNLGNLALEDGDVDGAITRYQEALAVNEEFANAHHNLGVAYRRKGEVGKSVRHLRKGQRLSYRQDAADARESFTNRGGGKRFSGALRWVMWAAIGAVAWWVLRSQGVI